MDLPGELRNQIYAYIIYPDLPSLMIANCARPEHLAASVLHLPLFRICRQVRAEALSYLCANIPLRILGLQTANVFFSCVGSAVSNVKSLVLVQAAMGIQGSKESGERVDKFFRALDMMHELAEMKLEGVGEMLNLEKGREHAEFVRRVEAMRERGITVHIRSASRLGR